MFGESATGFDRMLAEGGFSVAVAALALGLVLSGRAMVAYRRMTGIKTIGTSRVASAAVGEVRLTGLVSFAGPTMVSPLSAAPCVYYRRAVTEATDVGDGARIKIETGSVPFVLEDDSGSVTVFTRDARWDLPGGVDQGEEAIVPVGSVVTVVGSLLPYGELDDVFDAESSDPIVAEELAAARAEGKLASSPEEAWGNAAIPGFGIGKPIRAPVLDPQATPMPVVRARAAPRGAKQRDGIALGPEALVVAAGPGHPLLISLGTPVQAVRRADSQFALAGIGIALAACGAFTLAWLIATGRFPLPPAD